MAAPTTPPVLPVPDADRALDRHGRIWHCFRPSTDPYSSLWERPDTGAGATWALLQGVAHGPVVAYRSDEWAVA